MNSNVHKTLRRVTGETPPPNRYCTDACMSAEYFVISLCNNVPVLKEPLLCGQYLRGPCLRGMYGGRSVLCCVMARCLTQRFEFTELVQIEGKYRENRLLGRDKGQQQLYHEHAFLETGTKKNL
jgi:hypothetical protein